MTPLATDLPQRRLALGVAELEVLRRQLGDDIGRPGGVALPPGFGTAMRPSGSEATDDHRRCMEEAALAAAAERLTARGILTLTPGGSARYGDVVPPVRASLAALAAPQLLVTMTATCDDRGLLAAVALRAGLGAGLIRTDDTHVELSWFRAGLLGGTLARAVPALAASGEPFPDVSVQLRVLELLPAALRAGPEVVAALATEHRLPAGDIDVVRRVEHAWRGGLRAVVVAPRRGTAALGQVLWLALTTGWVAVEPAPRTDASLVRLRPVRAADLARCVAPFVAAALHEDASADGADHG